MIDHSYGQPGGSHFWLTSDALSLTLNDVMKLTDEEAEMTLAEFRWGDAEKPCCQWCGVVGDHYRIPTRKQWRCCDCFRNFSVTSGTPFADCKIGCRKLLIAIVAFVINQKGLAALALRRFIDCSYRTAFVLLHKIREAIMVTTAEDKLLGTVEMDGGHFSGRRRKRRRKEPKPPKAVPVKYRQHRQKTAPNSYPPHHNRRIVIVMRQTDPSKLGGASRTVTAICRSEHSLDVEALAGKWIAAGTEVRTDELPAYRNLKFMGFTHQTVNHSVEFCTDDGINQNQAESFFSRMRRACIGVYHRVTPRYMLDYTMEMAWREDERRNHVRQQVKNLIGRICGAGISADWKNYCRRGYKRKYELLFESWPPLEAFPQP